MSEKYQILAGIPSITLVVALLLFAAHMEDKNVTTGQSCRQLVSGSLIVSVKYGNQFVSRSDEQMIRIFKMHTSEENQIPVLMVEANQLSQTTGPDDTAEIIESIMRISKAEMQGPIFDSRKTFNGYEAAYARTDTNSGIREYYKVPMKNQILIFSFYSTSTWSAKEKLTVQELLDGIEITVGHEDEAATSVQRCQ